VSPLPSPVSHAQPPSHPSSFPLPSSPPRTPLRRLPLIGEPQPLFDEYGCEWQVRWWRRERERGGGGIGMKRKGRGWGGGICSGGIGSRLRCTGECRRRLPSSSPSCMNCRVSDFSLSAPSAGTRARTSKSGSTNPHALGGLAPAARGSARARGGSVTSAGPPPGGSASLPRGRRGKGGTGRDEG